MTVTKPYGTESIVKDYIRNVGGLAANTITKLRDTATNEADGFMQVDPSIGIADDYKFRPSIDDFCDLFAACRAHLMFGDALDAQYYCDLAEKKKAFILANDPSLKTETAGHVNTPEPKTYPSNPFGVTLMGNTRGEVS